MAENLYHFFKKSKGITTDTRKISKGQIYVALRGAHFDGNHFAKQAIESGAMLAVVDDESLPNEYPYFKVENCLKALQQLAAHHRSTLNVPVLAIGGSNGKTTSKELIASVLSTKYHTFSTPGNYNNHIGVPLSILMIPDDIELIVLELGANHPGEIAELCQIAKPTHGYITNVGLDHLEGFGSADGVLAANAELYDFLKQNQGVGFFNTFHQDLFKRGSTLTSKISFPQKSDDFEVKSISTALGNILETKEGERINSALPGRHNFENLAAAVAIGQYFKVSAQNMKKAIEAYRPKNNRSQIEEYENAVFIMDAYNANPSSMKASIQSAIDFAGKRKLVLLLGDMFEMGEYADQLHYELLEWISSFSIMNAYFFGEYFSKHSDKFTEFRFYSNIDSVDVQPLVENCKQAIVLVKGSRSMQMEKLAELIKSRLHSPNN